MSARRSFLACLALIAVALTPSAVGAPQVRILDDLLSVYPFGLPGEVTSNGDGSLLFCGEGGAIAFLHSIDQAGMRNA